MSKTVIVSAARTPFGKFGGALSDLRAVDLGGIVLKEVSKRGQVNPADVDAVLMGMVLQAGAGQIPSRQAARLAGYPWEVQSETINKVCASGLRAVSLADQIIRAGDAEIIAAGGMESMSQAPYLLPKARWGLRMGDHQLQDAMIHDGLTCAFDNVHMAVHGSNVAEEFKVSREAQDEWALRSHQLAVAAAEAGRLQDEIVPVSIPQRKGDPLVVSSDEAPRKDTSLAKLSQLNPVFATNGTITAGNAPGVNDGAGAFMLMSAERAEKEGKKPLATILGHAAAGDVAPYLAKTPALAIQKLLKKTGYSVEQIDLFEINEAFAAVALTSAELAQIPHEKLNVNGGAIALGHPIGASGSRILMTLIYELKRRGGGLGIAAICSGAAQGDAILVRVDG